MGDSLEIKTLEKVEAVIFDLDGTLLNTAPDIIGACNATLVHFGYKAISEELAYTKVTAGMREMLKLGVPQNEWDSADIEGKMRDFFAKYYTDHICDRTYPYEGMEELLADYARLGIKFAVVTNKYYNMAVKLLAKFSFNEKLGLILGCDSVVNAKPHPEPILKTLEALKVKAEHAVYVGDHLNDIKSANAAHTVSAVALWGYGGNEVGDPATWNANYLLKDVNDLRKLTIGS